MKKPPGDCYCAKCGAKPGDACKTIGGNRTTFHRARVTFVATREHHLSSTRLECWRSGFKAGTNGMKTAQAMELKTTFICPQDWDAGWAEGTSVLDRYEEAARKRYKA